jgi:hypothetical protein
VIAADTSTWMALPEGAGGEDAELLDRALQDRHAPMAIVNAGLDLVIGSRASRRNRLW